MPTQEITPMDTSRTTTKLTKLGVLGHLHETTKQAAKKDAEKKRAAEEAAEVKEKEKERKRESQREARAKKKEARDELKRIAMENKKKEEEKKKEEDKEIAEYAAKDKSEIIDEMMGWDSSDEEVDEDVAKKTLFGEEDVDINSPDYKKGKSNGGSNLKSNWRYSNRGEYHRKSGSTTAPGYGRTDLSKYTTYVEIAIKLKSEDKPSEFLGGIQGLLKECQLLTEAGLVELSPQANNEPLVIRRASDVPTSYTLVYKFVNIKSENPFKASWNDKKKQANHRDNDEEKTFEKVVWATVRITADIEISEVIKGISMQLGNNGVERLFIKKVQAAETKFVAMLLFVSLRTTEEVIRHALLKLFNKVLVEEKEDMLDDDATWESPLGLKLQVPQLYNIGNAMNTMVWKAKQLRQAYHIEVPSDMAMETLRIIRQAKDLNLISTVFNQHAIIAEVMTKEDSIPDNERMMKCIVDVADYNYNMTSIKIGGFSDMSREVFIAGDDTEAITGLEFLPKVLKVAGGIPLIAEIYQLGPGCEVEIVFLDCPEGHHMLAQMKKNPAAYIFHALRKIIDEESVRTMAVNICEVFYANEIDECEWNEDTKTLIIPSETEGNKVLECKDSPFWKMAIDLVEKDDLEKKAKNKINIETLIDLDNVRSIKSIHNRSKKKSGVSFNINQNVDELSASSTSTIDSLEDDNHNTEATGNIPSVAQASTSVVSPKGSVDGSSPAARG